MRTRYSHESYLEMMRRTGKEVPLLLQKVLGLRQNTGTSYKAWAFEGGTLPSPKEGRRDAAAHFFAGRVLVYSEDKKRAGVLGRQTLGSCCSNDNVIIIPLKPSKTLGISEKTVVTEDTERRAERWRCAGEGASGACVLSEPSVLSSEYTRTFCFVFRDRCRRRCCC